MFLQAYPTAGVIVLQPREQSHGEGFFSVAARIPMFPLKSLFQCFMDMGTGQRDIAVLWGGSGCAAGSGPEEDPEMHYPLPVSVMLRQSHAAMIYTTAITDTMVVDTTDSTGVSCGPVPLASSFPIGNRPRANWIAVSFPLASCLSIIQSSLSLSIASWWLLNQSIPEFCLRAPLWTLHLQLNHKVPVT